MTQQQVEMRKKRARTIFGPVSKFVQKCNGREERDLELSQNFFTKMSFTNKKKPWKDG